MHFYKYSSFTSENWLLTVFIALLLPPSNTSLRWFEGHSVPISAGDGADKTYQLLKFMGKKEKKRY